MPTRKDISSGSKVPTRNDVEGWRHWQTCARQGHNRQHQVAERDVARQVLTHGVRTVEENTRASCCRKRLQDPRNQAGGKKHTGRPLPRVSNKKNMWSGGA